MPFTGSYEHSIDAKNRLSIPAAIRSAMHPQRDGDRFYVVPGRREYTISLVGNARFEEFAASRRSNLVPVDDELTFDQLFFGNAYLLDFDKQGRVLLPERVVQEAQLGKEVTIIGVNDYVDIWDRQRYREFLAENQSRFLEVRRKAARPAAGPGAEP
jgi:MraZ protein